MSSSSELLLDSVVFICDSFMDWIVPPPPSCVKSLNPNVTLFGQKSLGGGDRGHEGNTVNLNLIEFMSWLAEGDPRTSFSLHRARKSCESGHSENMAVCTIGRQCSPQTEMSSFQDCEEIDFCFLSHQFGVLLWWPKQTNQGVNTKLQRKRPVWLTGFTPFSASSGVSEYCTSCQIKTD
jgi:hypothetical protein